MQKLKRWCINRVVRFIQFFHLAYYSEAGFLSSLFPLPPHTPELPGQSVCMSIVLFPPHPPPERMLS